MNLISGRVLLKESGVGIADLVVVAYMTTDGAGAEKDRLGAVVTGKDGEFELEYEDLPPATERELHRPNLSLVVQAPDEMDGNREPVVLYASPAPRTRAGKTEQYLIRLTVDQLKAAGVAAPAGTTAPELERPEAAIRDMQVALGRQGRVTEEMRRLASEQVTHTRERTREVDSELQPRLVEQLTGVSTRLFDRLGVVPPDAGQEEIEAANWGTIARNVEETVNDQPAAVGYIQVPNAEMPRFKTDLGELRTDLSAAEVEPYLFGGSSPTGRSLDRVREDPVALARHEEAYGRTLQDALAEPEPPPPADDEEEPAHAPASMESLPSYLGRLLEGVASPEDGGDGSDGERPTREDVERGTEAFSLRAGPADVPAFYDFHKLQIAFDHVWKHEIDEQVLEKSRALALSLVEAGADPVSAMDAGADPVAALRSEVRNVQRARTPKAMSSVMAKPVGGSRGSEGRAGIDEGGGGLDDMVTSVKPGDSPAREPHELLNELEALLHEKYKFEVFAPGSVNFGLNVTYRQRWEPLSYQVGDLVKTITLTPDESRKVTTKRTLKKERVVRELENSLRVRKDESSDSARDEAEIVRKAQGKTSFSLAAQGSFDIGIAEGDSTTSFAKDAATESADVKKAFREAVLKAAQEYKDERKLEVETKETLEEEVSETTDIHNKNDALTVAYLFYELQRRFRVSEHLHRLTPVVLVAMEVPNPSRGSIDRLLLTHSWIVSRVLLDDRYRPALTYLTTRIVGDELAVREQYHTVQKLRRTVDAIQTNHSELLKEVKSRNAALEHIMSVRADKVAAEGAEGTVEKTWEWVVGSGAAEDLEAARVREENAREAYEKAAREERQLRESLQSESAALNAATNAYAKAFAEHANRLLEVASLRVHVKANILYYMQAIWSHTFRDQHFFSLQKVKVPVLKEREKSYAVSEPEEAPAHVAPQPDTTILEVSANVSLEPPPDPAQAQEFLTLAEVADLDNPLGFKGNYMIFPLRRSNPLTDAMMVPWVDGELGLHDPDELGSWTPDDFVRYVRSLKQTLSEAEFDALEPQLAEQYRRLVSAPRRTQEDVVVPSDSLYIEALPGAHPNLEDFKLRHRAADVQRVRGEVRRLELENVRYAARVLAGEREDPDVERKVVIDGDADAVVVPPTDN